MRLSPASDEGAISLARYDTHDGRIPEGASPAYAIVADGHILLDLTAREADALAARYVRARERPTIVCLCGSTRYKDHFARAGFHETLAKRIVLSIGCDAKSDNELKITDEMKKQLDELHLRKIELADEVLIIDVDGYVGESTRNEIAHAERLGKKLRSYTREYLGTELQATNDHGDEIAKAVR